MSISIDKIEETLASYGVVTDFTGDDDGTVFTMTNGGQEIELRDAVSGEWFRAEDLTAAFHFSDGPSIREVTSAFEDAETMAEFLTAVNDTFGIVV